MVDGNRPSNPNAEGRPGWLAHAVGYLVTGLALLDALTATTPAGSVTPDTPAGPAPEGDHQPPGGLEHASVHYEHSDAKLGWIIGLLIGAMIFAAGMHYVVLRFYRSHAAYEANIKHSQYPLAGEKGRLPPPPRLEQISRMADIEAGNVSLREEAKEEILHTYGTLPETGYIRVPIEQAMDFLAQPNRLPTRRPPSGNQTQRQNGLLDSGESNSGRILRR